MPELELVYFTPLLFGFVHGLLFLVLLVVRGKREERPSDLLLAALIGCGCLLILPTLLGLLDIHVLWNEWLFLPLDPGLLIGPLLLLFVQARTNARFIFGRGMAVHFIPFLVYAGYHLVVFVQGREVVFRWMDTVDLPFVEPVYQFASLASMSAYLFFAIRHFVSYRRWLEAEYATPERHRYPWIVGVLGAVSLAILATCLFRVAETFFVDVDYIQSWWSALVVTGAIYFVSISGFVSARARQPVFVPPSHNQVIGDVSGSSDYSSEQLDTLMGDLAQVMTSKRLFLDPDLSLGDVATELKISRKMVSLTINAGFKKNFRRYVNELRIDAFKKLVQSGKADEMTLFGLALDCGFNSKATFNRVFKQVEAVAPNVYVNTIRGQKPVSSNMDSEIT